MPPAPRNWHAPLLSQRGRDIKWNIDGSYKKICRCQASDEVVSRFVKFVVEGHDGDYKSVTKDATNADNHKQNYLYVHLNITFQWRCFWGGFSCIQLGFLCGVDHFANFPQWRRFTLPLFSTEVRDLLAQPNQHRMNQLSRPGDYVCCILKRKKYCVNVCM